MSRHQYYDGKLWASDKGNFEWRIEVDEDSRSATITEYKRLSTNEIVEYDAKFVITYIDKADKNDADFLFKPKSKSGQKLICMVGNPGALATEMFLIGDNYFEYSKASSARLEVASGTVRKSITVFQEIKNNAYGS
jgi:hypothetical protein